VITSAWSNLMEEADGALSVSPHRTQTRVYYRTNGKWPDLTLFHRLSSSSDSLLPRNLLRKEGIIVRALSVYWHHRTYRIAVETNLITPVFRVTLGAVLSPHNTASLFQKCPHPQILYQKNNRTPLSSRTQQTAGTTLHCVRRKVSSVFRRCPSVQELSTGGDSGGGGGVKGSSTTAKRHFCHLPLPSAGVRELYGASSRWL